jgi:hypothetical protein
MGGRVYDPEIGRFLSPDPFVQFPASTQGFNRYAYVGNNPLSYTDPSGYFLKKLFKAFGIAMNFVPGLQLPNAFIHGFVSGFLISGGDPKAAMLGGIGASAFNSIGNQFSGGSFGSTAHLQKTLAQGMTGGLLSAAGGGRFGDGFLGAATAQLAAPAIDQIGRGADGRISTDAGVRFARITAAATVGGTASTLGGGKFANGAITAGFARAFNDEAHLEKSSDAYYSRDKTKILATRMDVVALEDPSRTNTKGKLVGFFADLLSIRKGAVSLGRGVAYYEKIDTIVVERQWFAKSTDQALGVKQIGLPYEVRDVSGAYVHGYSFIGNGIYQRETIILNGTNMEWIR